MIGIFILILGLFFIVLLSILILFIEFVFEMLISIGSSCIGIVVLLLIIFVELLSFFLISEIGGYFMFLLS